MRPQLVLTIFTAATLCLTAADRAREVQLQQALDLMQTKGDLPGAMKLLEEVGKSTDRNLVARSLLYLGDCRQKLGQQEASKPYERVVRDFADQREIVAEARARLAAIRTPVANRGGMTTRQVWTDPKIDMEGTVSGDGRYISFPDTATGNLAIHDFVTGKDRVVTDKSSQDAHEYAEDSAISRDGKRVAYTWYNSQQRYDLRVADLTTGSSAKARIISFSDEIEWVAPYDWNWNDTTIAVRVLRKDRTSQIGIVALADGRLRVLKSVDWRGVANLCFSPNGKYLAYDVPSEDAQQRDIFLLSTDASQDIRVVGDPADDGVLGWSPDGRYLLFASDRGGTRGLWALPVADGRAQGAPVLVKPDIGEARGRGVTRMGTLYIGVQTQGPDIYLASVDFASGKVVHPLTKPIKQYVGSNRMPAFSFDGKQLAYQSRRDQHASVLGIRSLETGQAREFRLDLFYFQRPELAPGGQYVAVEGYDRKGRRGLFRGDIQSGAVTPIFVIEPRLRVTWHMWSRDGATLYFQRDDGAGNVIVAHNLASGAERNLIRQKDATLGRVSPDGASAILITDRRTGLKIISIEGGEQREVLRVNPGETIGQVEWTPDGHSLVAIKSKGTSKELLCIPISGGAPQKIELNIDGLLSFAIHPDGRRIAFSKGSFRREIWAIENFLSMLQEKK